MYHNRQVTESTLQLMDDGYTLGHALAITNGSLATMAKKPKTIAAINRARKVSTKERYAELNKGAGRMLDPLEPTTAEREAINAVWRTLPGNTCFKDALTITARL